MIYNHWAKCPKCAKTVLIAVLWVKQYFTEQKIVYKYQCRCGCTFQKTFRPQPLKH